MSLTASSPRVGELLRDWRRRRHLSQLDLSIEAEVSSRHLSFVETGRSRPSRELLLHLAEHLEVPLRERNALLLAAGFAPVYRETPMDAEEMAPVRAALDKILAGHEPFPAVAVDRRSGTDPTRQAADQAAPDAPAGPVSRARAAPRGSGGAATVSPACRRSVLPGCAPHTSPADPRRCTDGVDRARTATRPWAGAG